MKKTYIGYSVLAAVLALSAQQANAQQGFGTDKPSKASVVEMTSGSKGLLIPRVALDSLNSFAPVSGEAPTDVDKTDALLVYNTVTAGTAPNDVTPGYYYWTTDGTTGKWNRIATGADAKAEPWFDQATNTEATDNEQNIYQMGSVAIGKDEATTGVALDIEGAVRGGNGHTGTVGANSVAFGNGNTASTPNAVAFGLSNSVTGGNSSVTGGRDNQVTAFFSVVSGGRDNQATGLANAIGGGAQNYTAGQHATVAGGYQNRAEVGKSTVSGGERNIASGDISTVSGGIANMASGRLSAVVGGTTNIASGEFSTTMGGAFNTAIGAFSVVAGRQNTAFSQSETVFGAYATEYGGNATDLNSNDRLFNIGKGINESSRSDAFTILKSGKTGIGFDNFETRAVGEMLQVNGNAQFVTLPTVTGDTATDKVVVADADGVLKTVAASTLSTEPWKIQNTTNEATDNADNIYQQGKVAVGFTDADAVSDKQFEVKGDIRTSNINDTVYPGAEINYGFESGMLFDPLYNMDIPTSYLFNRTTLSGGRETNSEVKNTSYYSGLQVKTEEPSTTRNSEILAATDHVNILLEYSNSDTDLTTKGGMNIHPQSSIDIYTEYPDSYLTKIQMTQEQGITFVFKDEDGNDEGYYIFPRNSGATNQVLKRVGVNETEWSNVSDLIEVSNGLEKNATDVIQLGGDLIKDTKITLDENELEIDATDSDLIISGLDKTKVQATNATTGITDHLLAVDANNNVKALKAAMPKFFYMPSIIVPTSEEQLNATGAGKVTGDAFNDATRQGTIQLHTRYAEQFGLTGTAQASSTGAPALPVLPADELHYYVTWYDINVFETVSVSNTGVLTYTVKSDADITIGSFMNIVFAVRED